MALNLKPETWNLERFSSPSPLQIILDDPPPQVAGFREEDPARVAPRQGGGELGEVLRLVEHHDVEGDAGKAAVVGLFEDAGDGALEADVRPVLAVRGRVGYEVACLSPRNDCVRVLNFFRAPLMSVIVPENLRFGISQ